MRLRKIPKGSIFVRYINNQNKLAKIYIRKKLRYVIRPLSIQIEEYQYGTKIDIQAYSNVKVKVDYL